jgi:hypothetical protein
VDEPRPNLGAGEVTVFRTQRFTRNAVFGMLIVMAVLVPALGWAAVADGSGGAQVLVFAWAAAVAMLWYLALFRTAIRVELDPDGACRFYGPLGLLAEVNASEIAELSARRSGNSPYMRVRFTRGSVRVLDIARIERFAARVRRENPDVRVQNLARLSTARSGRRGPDPEEDTR